MTKNAWSDGDSVTATQLNRMEDQLVITCTSATRPTGVEGQRIWETDTDSEYVYDGSAWVSMRSPWTSFTPSWNNVTVGNGTSTGSWCYVPGGIRVLATFTLGSTSSISGAVSLTIPASLSSRNVGNLAFGICRYQDDTGADELGFCDVGPTSDTTINLFTSTVVAVSTTVPFTWATSDSIRLDITVPY